MKLASLTLGVASILVGGSQLQAQQTPSFVHAGTRVVFFEGSATIANAGQKWVPGGNGMWQINGQNVKPESITGSGGGGYTVLDAGHVDNNSTSFVFSHYGLADVENHLSVPLLEMNPFGAIQQHWESGHYWRDPQELAKMPEGTVSGVTVVHMKYPMGKIVFNAVRIVIPQENGGNIDTYDSETGLLLFSSIASTSNAPLVNGNGAAWGAASTNVSMTKLVCIRDTNLPWANMQAPNWVGQVQSINFNQDLETVAYQGAPGFHQPSKTTFAFTNHTSKSVSYDIQFPGTDEVVKMANGSGNRMGLFLPPAVIAQLHEGQVLDEDKILGTTLEVVANDGRTVTLMESNGLYHTKATYGRDGMLLSNEIAVSSYPGVKTFRMVRTGVR